MLQQSTVEQHKNDNQVLKMWSVGPELFTFILPFKRATPPIIQKPSIVEALFITATLGW